MKLWRDALEQRERDILAPYALKSGDSRGRAYPEDESEDRTAFQKDRDRILNTAAFRRLQYKTQIFINTEGDYYRTRLTHTLEVMQIGRTLARVLGANEDLVEAICLAHDLGHPPFGHAGEVILNDMMRDHGGFEHNAQSLRILRMLENQYPDFPGLNLTYETLEGLANHETVQDNSGLYPDFNALSHASFEAQIADASDSLAYTTHDLDDGLHAGFITPYMLDGLALWEIVKDELGMASTDIDEQGRHQMIRRLTGILVADMAQATEERLRETNPQTPEDIQTMRFHVVGFSHEVENMMTEMKRFVKTKLIKHHRVVRMERLGDRIIKGLFNAYLEDPGQLPTTSFELARTESDSIETVICDYIASMTDRFALQEYQELFLPIARV